MTTAKSLALDIVLTDRVIKDETETLKTLKEKLVKKVGDDGDKFVTSVGIVTVTKKTETRPNGKVNYQLDMEKFLELDEHIQANLIKVGVVQRLTGVTAGQAPTVKVQHIK